MTRWLSDEEQAAWRRLTGLFTILPAALDAQLQRDAGLSHFEYGVLSALSEAAEETLRMNDLAGLANGSPSRLSHVAGRLQRQGWLTRRPDPADGRFTLATLTPAGRAKVVDSAPGHVEAVRRAVFDALTPDQVGQLQEIAALVVGSVDPARAR